MPDEDFLCSTRCYNRSDQILVLYEGYLWTLAMQKIRFPYLMTQQGRRDRMFANQQTDLPKHSLDSLCRNNSYIDQEKKCYKPQNEDGHQKNSRYFPLILLFHLFLPHEDQLLLILLPLF